MAPASCPRLAETPKSTTSSISLVCAMPLMRASAGDSALIPRLGRARHARVDAMQLGGPSIIIAEGTAVQCEEMSWVEAVGTT